MCDDLQGHYGGGRVHQYEAQKKGDHLALEAKTSVKGIVSNVSKSKLSTH